MGKAEIIAADEIYATARQQADAEMAGLRGEMEAVREESYALGVLKKIEYDCAHNEMLKYAVLHRIKQAKDYRKGGMTWAQFCKAIGEDVRTVDRTIKDILPLYELFSVKLTEISGVGLNKIRYLGRSISDKLTEIEEGCLLIGDSKIPLSPEHKDEISAAIDALKESHAKALADEKAIVRAKDKVLKAKDDVINRQEKEITKLEARPKAAPPEEEEAFLKKLEAAKLAVQAWFAEYDPAISPVLPPNATPRMRAELLSTLGFFARYVTGLYSDAQDLIGQPDVDFPADPNDFGPGATVFPEDLPKDGEEA